MSGILSSRPAAGPVRLLVGTQLMLLVQTVLIFEASAPLPTPLRALLVMNWVVGVSALIAAVRGSRADQAPPWWRRRHDR